MTEFISFPVAAIGEPGILSEFRHAAEGGDHRPVDGQVVSHLHPSDVTTQTHAGTDNPPRNSHLPGDVKPLQIGSPGIPLHGRLPSAFKVTLRVPKYMHHGGFGVTAVRKGDIALVCKK